MGMRACRQAGFDMPRCLSSSITSLTASSVASLFNCALIKGGEGLACAGSGVFSVEKGVGDLLDQIRR
jgi:hypothetical protein